MDCNIENSAKIKLDKIDRLVLINGLANKSTKITLMQSLLRHCSSKTTGKYTNEMNRINRRKSYALFAFSWGWSTKYN